MSDIVASMVMWGLIVIAGYAGFSGHSITIVAALAVAVFVTYSLLRPGALLFGLRERGVMFVVWVLAFNSTALASVFFAGKLASYLI